MTIEIDLYYTMRSPYCYLATPQLRELFERYDLAFRVKPVYPIALTQPDFFKRVNPLWPAYVKRDTTRIAARLGVPFQWPPNPDPITQDPETLEVAAAQPRIRRLTRLAQLAGENGCGFEFVCRVSRLIFDPAGDGWDAGPQLAHTLASIDLDLTAMDESARVDGKRLDAAIAANRADQLAAGHWGAPLFVTRGAVFFGQDRIVDLQWHLEQLGSTSRLHRAD